MKITQALILCGGKGTRLGELTREIPKPLLPVGGRPVLDHIMDSLVAAGVNRFILLAGHLGAHIEQHYQKHPRRNCAVEVIVEDTPRGTAGAVALARDFLDENFVLAYGDVFIDFAGAPMLAQHASTQPIGTLLVRASDHPWDSHLIEADASGLVQDFVAVHQPGRRYRNLANAAFYVLNRTVVDFIPRHRPSDFGADVFPAVLRAGYSLRTYSLPEEEFVKDMGTPERLAAVEQYLQERALARAAAAHPAQIKTLLIDRDGTLNTDAGLITRPEQIELLPGVREAMARFNQLGLACHVVTNQPVIARGLCNEDRLAEIHDRLNNLIIQAGGRLSGIYYCPHHPETHHGQGVTELRRGCRCRKPAPGLIFRAQKEHGFNLASAVMVGDRSTDIRAGQAAGLRTVLIGYSGQRAREAACCTPDAQFESLQEFAESLSSGLVFTS